jgi:hypothetical protein
MRDDIHDGHSGHFPDPSLQVLIAGGHDVAAVLPHPLYDAIVGVGSFVVAS